MKVIHFLLGLAVCAGVSLLCMGLSNLLPHNIISASVIALLIGIACSQLLSKTKLFDRSIKFMSKDLLRISIILMGFSLSISQVAEVGLISLVVMSATLFVAFIGGHFIAKLMKINWKQSTLISAGTGICGGSAIGAISPVIKAKNSDIAIAMSATFIFDIVMVVLFPIMGKALGMSDMGFGLWAGTAVNDTSSVVATGYAFSDIAGSYSIIVKLTRTLSIIPITLILSVINNRIERKEHKLALANNQTDAKLQKPQKLNLLKIFPYFILLFLVAVIIKSINIVSDSTSLFLADSSKFFMVMALFAIGTKTKISEIKESGFKPMVFGFVISILVVLASLLMQILLGQI